MQLKSNLLLIIILSLFFTITQIQNPVFAKKGFAKDTSKNSVSLSVEQKKKVIVTSINYDDILKQAKDHSYDLKIADYNVLISKQGVRGARSEYFPRLNLGGGYEYTKNFRDVADTTIMSIGDAFINPYTRFQSILGVNVAYNLFDF